MLVLRWLAQKNVTIRPQPSSHRTLLSLIGEFHNTARSVSYQQDPWDMPQSTFRRLFSLLDSIRSELSQLEITNPRGTSSQMSPLRSTHEDSDRLELHPIREERGRSSLRKTRRKEHLPQTTALTVAKRLIARGDSSELVARKTLLSIETINSLQDQHIGVQESTECQPFIEREALLL